MLLGLDVLLWFIITCYDIPIEPEIVAAVAVVESSTKHEPIRFGPLGKKGRFIGPMGLHRDFRKQWDIDDPVINTRVGAWTLVKKIRKYGSLIEALKKYNEAYTVDYGKKVLTCYNQFKKCRKQRR